MVQLKIIFCSQEISASFWCNIGPIFLECISCSLKHVFRKLFFTTTERFQNVHLLVHFKITQLHAEYAEFLMRFQCFKLVNSILRYLGSQH